MNYRAWQLKNADTAGESALLAAGYGPLLEILRAAIQ